MRRHAKAPSAGSNAHQAGLRRARLPKLALLAAAALTLTVVLGVSIANAVVPSVTVEDATNVEYVTADVKGTVEPHGQSTEWRFQYATEANFSNAQTGPSGTTETAGPVSATLTGLQPSTTYHLRLLAENADSAGTPSEALAASTFTTKAVAKPTPSLGAIATFTATTAHVVGHVNPNAPEAAPASAVVKAGFNTAWSISCVPGCGSPEGSVEADDAANQFQADLSGLKPNTPYTLTLHATNAGGEETATAPIFTTAQTGPTAIASTNTPESESEVLLRGAVNPLNSTVTDCHFAYGPASGGFEQSAPCVGNAENAEPPLPAPIEGGEPQLVTAKIGGLTAGYAGHFKVVITTSGGGPVESEAMPFSVFAAPEEESCSNQARREEQHSTALPECRAYEMVSPLDKNGGDILISAIRTRAAADGNALDFASLSAFADVRGTGIDTEYIARRDAASATQGWSTHAITPQVKPGSLSADGLAAKEPIAEGEFSPDLSRAVLHSYTPLTDEPNTAQVSNLYLREGNLAPGPGSYRILTPCPLCAENHQQQLTVSASAGTYTLSFMGQTSADIAFNAPAAESEEEPGEPGSLEKALATLSTIGAGNVSVSGGRGNPNGSHPYLIAFSGTLAEGSQPLLLAAGAGLGAGSATVASAPLIDPSLRYRPRLAAATPDLGQFIFEANRRLTADAPSQPFFCSFGGNCNPTLYESDHGTLRLVGRIPPPGQVECDDAAADPCQTAPRSIAGAGALNRIYTPNTISTDGSKVFFTVHGSEGENNEGALYMRFDHTRTVQLNASERTDCADHSPCTGAPEPDSSQPAEFQIASADGSRVFFTATEQLTDGDHNHSRDLYMYDTTLPPADPHNLTLISIDGVDGVLGGVGRDGNYVYFERGQDLVAGQPPLHSSRGYYAWHNGSLSFVGSIPIIASNASGANDLGISWLLRVQASRVTPDGQVLLFVSSGSSGLTGNDCAEEGSVPCTELYLYRADTHTLLCVSCNPTGAPPHDSSGAEINAEVNVGGAGRSTHLSHAITDGGRLVFFDTAERLVPEDTNGFRDVYSYDTHTGAIHLLSSGTSSSDSYFLDASPDGKDVFFATNQRLLGWDGDGSYDIYDARAGGGFPEPRPTPASCEGDTCRSVAPPPAPASPQSAGFTGPGNPKPKQACLKGKVKEHSECVKGKIGRHSGKKHHAKNQHGKKASRKQGGGK